jgi:hypothetical protein
LVHRTTRQLIVAAAGVSAVLGQYAKLTLFAVGQDTNPAFDPAGAALNEKEIESVVATPVADTVTVVPQFPAVIAAVVIVAVPLAITRPGAKRPLPF